VLTAALACFCVGSRFAEFDGFWMESTTRHNYFCGCSGARGHSAMRLCGYNETIFRKAHPEWLRACRTQKLTVAGTFYSHDQSRRSLQVNHARACDLPLLKCFVLACGCKLGPVQHDSFSTRYIITPSWISGRCGFCVGVLRSISPRCRTKAAAVFGLVGFACGWL
jgi:hypothetical protein